jgi:hypothetical protein
VGFISIGGGLLATLGSDQHSSPGTIASPPGLGLPADRASADLRVITSGGEPPADIVDALVVPASARLVSHVSPADDLSLFDASVTLSVPVAPANVVAFYKFELAREGWHISAVDGGTSGGTNLYALRNSNDGYTWEVGVLVNETNGAITPALDGGGTPAETSSVEIRLIERDDES